MDSMQRRDEETTSLPFQRHYGTRQGMRRVDPLFQLVQIGLGLALVPEGHLAEIQLHYPATVNAMLQLHDHLSFP